MRIYCDSISNFESLLRTIIMASNPELPRIAPAFSYIARLRLGQPWCQISVFSVILILLACLDDASAKPVEAIQSRLYVNYSAKPDPQDLTTFDLCILDPEADVDLTAGHSVGHSFLAYISTVEVRPGSPMEKRVLKHKIPMVGGNVDWGTRLLDITDPEWLPMIVDGLARDASAKGYDGFFLDTLDSAELLTRQSPEKARSYHQVLVKLVKELRAKYPAAKIVTNRGFDLVDEIAADINGVLVESVFQTFDPKTKRYRSVSPDDTAWLERRIRSVQMHKLPVYAVDYVQPDQKDLAGETARKLSSLGCIPFVTTHDLNGTALAPLCEVPRRVLVLFGWEPAFSDKPAAKPADTLTGRHLQAPLQWLGYQAEYLDIGRQALPDPLPPRCAGIILDGQLSFRPDQEKTAERWLERQKERGTPILFAGDIAFRDAEVKDRLATSFGLTGSLSPVRDTRKMAIAKLDGGVMRTNGNIAPHSLGFKNIVAPASSAVFLSVRGEDGEGKPVHFDPVFVAPWGGMLLEPYVAFRAPRENQPLFVDPFKFLGRWLGAASLFPAPDTTTRDGRRLFFSHISGEGFTATAPFPGRPMCAEVVRDQILRQHPLPVTVSIDSAAKKDAPADKPDPESSLRHENVARSILSMTHVQAATFSASVHPVEVSGAVAAFERTEEPRRLAPVGLLYDAGIAASPQAVRRLGKVYEWCDGQRLHPITALEQARIAQDAVTTKTFRLGANHWLISNTGSLRTFRVPASAGVPDLARCRGVSGYKTEGDVTYIHTAGRPLTELVLVDPAAATPDQLHLIESGADITFHELTAQSALFQVGGWSTTEVVFGGMPPGAMITIKKNKEPGRLQADASGVLRLSLPARSTVTLNVPRMPYAASR